jgi:hypothetical protein
LRPTSKSIRFTIYLKFSSSMISRSSPKEIKAIIAIALSSKQSCS